MHTVIFQVFLYQCRIDYGDGIVSNARDARSKKFPGICKKIGCAFFGKLIVDFVNHSAVCSHDPNIVHCDGNKYTGVFRGKLRAWISTALVITLLSHEPEESLYVIVSSGLSVPEIFSKASNLL